MPDQLFDWYGIVRKIKESADVASLFGNVGLMSYCYNHYFKIFCLKDVEI
jgi:hypothetical protein